MKIELHMIQNFAPACLNRDDTNSPKDCEFGGVRRARISSQCIKRAIRWESSFREMLGDQLSIRSRRFPSDVRDELIKLGVEEKTANEIGKSLEGVAKKEREQAEAKKDATDELVEPDIFKTPQIAFYTTEEVSECTKRIKEFLDDGTKPKEMLKKLLGKAKGYAPQLPVPRTADIAMFGRMITSDAFKNIDAACQVAHAISTNKVEMEMDFFTAVDDLNPDEETGAGMMGVIGYNASCFYRYAVIDFDQLVHNLGGDRELAEKTVEAFLRASASAIPSGKQNTFAAHNPPDLILASVRNGGAPISLANAFAQPVRPSSKADLTAASANALKGYWDKLAKVYGANGHLAGPAYCGTVDLDTADGWDNVESFDRLVDTVMGAVAEGGGQ